MKGSRFLAKRLRWSRVLQTFGLAFVVGAGFVSSVAIGSASTSAASSTTSSTTAPPANESPPTISGSATVGQALSASTGSWSGGTPIRFAFEWKRCDSSGGACSTISGANSQTYSVVASDVGHTLRVAVTATNGAGTASQLSSSTAVVSQGPPVNTVAPKVSGTLSVGNTLHVSSGTWTGSRPIAVSYQWERCDSGGGNCGWISGATGPSYRIASADADHRLIVVVTGKNSIGSHQVVITAGNVGGGVPVNGSAPKVSGTLAVGSTLTVSSGSWSGTQPIAVSYQWERCDSGGGNCGWISGATGPSYRLASADAGHRLIVVVTARNSIGSHQVVVTAGNVGGTASGSVPVTAVSLPDRLIVDRVQFSPARIHSRAQPVVARFHVSDVGQGRPVSGALVYAVGVPFNRLSVQSEVQTGRDGWGEITFRVKPGFTLRRGNFVVLFVRARKPGGNVLAGVSTRRLVSVRVG